MLGSRNEGQREWGDVGQKGQTSRCKVNQFRDPEHSALAVVSGTCVHLTVAMRVKPPRSHWSHNEMVIAQSEGCVNLIVTIILQYIKHHVHVSNCHTVHLRLRHCYVTVSQYS